MNGKGKSKNDNLKTVFCYIVRKNLKQNLIYASFRGG